MPRQGWIKLHRSLVDNPIWLQKPFSEGQAWVDLLMLAETEEKDFVVNGCAIHQKPGEVWETKKSLMERWGWTRYALERVLTAWEAEKMISVQQHRIQHRNQHRTHTVVTIEKWGFFQVGGRKNSTESSTESNIHLKKTKKFYADGGALDAPSSAAEKKTRWYRDESGELRWEVVDE